MVSNGAMPKWRSCSAKPIDYIKIRRMRSLSFFLTGMDSVKGRTNRRCDLQEQLTPSACSLSRGEAVTGVIPTSKVAAIIEIV